MVRSKYIGRKFVSDDAKLFSRERRNVSIDRGIVLRRISCGSDNYPQTLEEKYPHVLEQVYKLWDSPAVEHYLNDLLKPSYSGGRYERAGFPSEAWDEIYQLLGHYQNIREAQNESGSRPSSFMGSLRSVFGKDKAGRD
jgi:hypothetical protein